jgi:hypothetical protein
LQRVEKFRHVTENPALGRMEVNQWDLVVRAISGGRCIWPGRISPGPIPQKKMSGSGKALHDSGGVPSERIQNALAHKGYFCMVIALLLLDIL